MTKHTSVKKLPRHVGILADPNFDNRDWIHSLLLELNPKSVVVTAQTSKIQEFIEKITILRGDLFLKVFENDPWELRYGSVSKAEKVRDYLLLSYLKFYDGHMFFFPVWYDTHKYGMHYSKRMQSMIYLAHQLKVPYDIIQQDGDGNDISTTY